MTPHRTTTQDAASEYLPSSEESSRDNAYANGQGRDNGNGHGKIFQLKPAIDPATEAILESRQLALRDERLSRPMKAFFCELLDRSLDPGYYFPHSRGIITMSDTVLAEVFRVSNRTIYTWKKGVEACGDYFWITMQFRKNMWPLTTYHMTCLHRPPRTKTDRDGTYGSVESVGRQPPLNPGLGARQPGQPRLPLPGSRQTPKKAKSAVLQGISALSREKLRLSPEENFGSEPKKISALSRNKFRARAEENFGSEPKKISGESRSFLRARAEADCRHIGDSEGVKAPLESNKGGYPPPQNEQFQIWLKELEGMFPSKLRQLATDLKGKVRSAQSDEAREEWKRRLAAVEERLLGGKVADAPTPKAPDPKAAKILERQPTAEEILEGARYLVSIGKTSSLTKAQREALKQADNPVPE